LDIKAIIWDMEGVLLLSRGGEMPAVIAEKLGTPYQETRDIFYGEFNDIVDLGHYTQDDFWNHVLDTLGKQRSMKKILLDFFYEDQFVDEVLAVAIREYKKHYKTGLITNYSKIMREMIETEWQVKDLFDEIIISSEVGLVKPDPRIYQLMLERLGCQPGEAVFIDDRIRNIVGARNAGLKAVLFENRVQALKELDEILEGNV